MSHHSTYVFGEIYDLVAERIFKYILQVKFQSSSCYYIFEQIALNNFSALKKKQNKQSLFLKKLLF